MSDKVTSKKGMFPECTKKAEYVLVSVYRRTTLPRKNEPNSNFLIYYMNLAAHKAWGWYCTRSHPMNAGHPNKQHLIIQEKYQHQTEIT